MRIGIDLLGESKAMSGSGRYSYEIVKYLSKIDNENEYFIFLPKTNDIKKYIVAKNIRYIEIPTLNSVVSRRFVEQTLLPLSCLKNNIDILFSTNNVGVFLLSAKNYVVVHDLIPWEIPWNNSKFNSFFLKILQICILPFSRGIVTVSEFSKERLVKRLRVKENKVHVNKIGLNSELFRIIDENVVNDNLKKKEIQKPYIFSFSSLEPRKNYIKLIEALEKANIQNLHFYFSGKKHYKCEEIFNKIENSKIKEKIKYLGYCSDEEIVSLLNGAIFTCSPSLYEGAGTTPLEGMLCGTPAIVSDIPPFHEYCGENAHYVNPQDVDSIAKGIKELYTNKELRDKLAQNSREQVKKFNYKNHAEKLLQIFKTY